ncbi:MAG: hypothetical protein QOE79_473 [Sphingomonadales bacterium]|nr:hypothetical protein [Sphingomonadales bacterium]
MATSTAPLAVYAQSDAVRAQPTLQALGNIAAAPVPNVSLKQPLHALSSLEGRLASADPIVLLVSGASKGSALFETVALFAQMHSKRLIVIDLDNAAQGAVSGGNLGHLSDTVIAACDPGLPEVIDGPDRWTLPSGDSYPEKPIKRQSKC